MMYSCLGHLPAVGTTMSIEVTSTQSTSTISASTTATMITTCTASKFVFNSIYSKHLHLYVYVTVV